ncbi:MAG: hypothetical protein R2880_08330 [Deinococcales bacterium]
MQIRMADEIIRAGGMQNGGAPMGPPPGDNGDAPMGPPPGGTPPSGGMMAGGR